MRGEGLLFYEVRFQGLWSFRALLFANRSQSACGGNSVQTVTMVFAYQGGVFLIAGFSLSGGGFAYRGGGGGG